MAFVFSLFLKFFVRFSIFQLRFCLKEVVCLGFLGKFGLWWGGGCTNCSRRDGRGGPKRIQSFSWESIEGKESITWEHLTFILRIWTWAGEDLSTKMILFKMPSTQRWFVFRHNQKNRFYIIRFLFKSNYLSKLFFMIENCAINIFDILWNRKTNLSKRHSYDL